MSPLEVPVGWRSEIEAWKGYLRASRLSEETIRLRVYHLTRLARADLAESPWGVRDTQILDWVGRQVWGRETARAVRSSFRSFWSWGLCTGITSVNAAELLPAIRPAQPRPRPAAAVGVAQAIRKATPTVALMIRLANELGMRRGEVAQVLPECDVVNDLTGWSLIVHGKGSKNRVLPLPDDLAQSLRSAPPGFLFPSPKGGHITPHWVGTLVSRALGDGSTMHQLRHLCATEVHEQTHDVRLVQALLGHASLATTQRYIAVDDSKMREAIADRSRRWGGQE